jgi:Amt family ammonium transporter
MPCSFGILTGILSFGVKDFAGGTVVHMSAGFAALAAIVWEKGKSMYLPIFLLFYWVLECFGLVGSFNAGSSLEANGVAAIIALPRHSAATMLTWIFFDRINGRKVSALGACIGAVVECYPLLGCGLCFCSWYVFLVHGRLSF